MQDPRNIPRGFTLLELMVSIVILTTLLIVGVPAISRFQSNSKLRTVVDTMAADLRLARSTAIQVGNTVVPRINAAAAHGALTPPTAGADSTTDFFVFSPTVNPDQVAQRVQDIGGEFTVTTGPGFVDGRALLLGFTSAVAFHVTPNAGEPVQLNFDGKGTTNQTFIRITNQVQQFRIDIPRIGDEVVTPEPPLTTGNPTVPNSGN